MNRLNNNRADFSRWQPKEGRSIKNPKNVNKIVGDVKGKPLNRMNTAPIIRPARIKSNVAGDVLNTNPATVRVKGSTRYKMRVNEHLKNS